MKKFNVNLSTLLEIRRGVYERDEGLMMHRVIVSTRGGALGAPHPAYGDEGPCCSHDAIHVSYPLHYDIPYHQNQSLYHNVETQWNLASGKRIFCGSPCRSETFPQGIIFNYRNQISFGAINVDIPSSEGILGLTALWYECLRPGVPVSTCISGYRIVEWDMVINTAENEIGDATSSSTLVDLLSLLLHEFGHVMGLGDIYSPYSCSTTTMWGWLLDGDTSKRLLDNMTKECVYSLYNNTNPTSPWYPSLSSDLHSILSI